MTAGTNIDEPMRISSAESVSRSRSSWDSEEEEEQSRTKEPISDNLNQQHSPIMDLGTSQSSSVVDEQDNASSKTITVDIVSRMDSLDINTLPRHPPANPGLRKTEHLEYYTETTRL